MGLRRGICLVAAAGLIAAAAATPASGEDPPAWLTVLNDYRAAGRLPQARNLPHLTESERLHSRYMVKNGEASRRQDPSNEWYTPEGDAAARNANVAYVAGRSVSDLDLLHLWLTSPFAAVGLLEPRLAGTAYATYRESAAGVPLRGGTIDIRRGRSSSSDLSYPYVWPADGAGIPSMRYEGGDFPDPLVACPGYETPVGAPLFAFFDGSVRATSSALTRGNTDVDHCVLDAQTYIGRDPAQSATGREFLAASYAIVVLPRNRLRVGSSYRLELATTRGDVSSRFTVTSGEVVSPAARPASPPPATPTPGVEEAPPSPSPEPAGEPEPTAATTDDDEMEAQTPRPAILVTPVRRPSPRTPAPAGTAGTAGITTPAPVPARAAQPEPAEDLEILVEPLQRPRAPAPFTAPEERPAGPGIVGWLAGGTAFVSGGVLWAVRRRATSTAAATVLWLRARGRP